VTRRAFVSHDVASRRVVLVNAAVSHEPLHLRTLAADVSNTLRSLFAWKPVLHGTAHAVRRRAQPLNDVVDMPMIAPKARHVLALPSAPDASVAGGVIASIAISDVEASTVLATIESESRNQGSEWVRAGINSPLGDVHADTLAGLGSEGALRFDQSEFGEVLVALNPGGTRHVSVRTCGDPVQAFCRGLSNVDTKLGVVLDLLRRGWVQAGNAPAPFTNGSQQLFVCSIGRQLSYYLCLRNAAALFAKGVSAIAHDLKDVQYQCLLRLNGDRLQQFLRALEAGLDEARCRALLREQGGEAIVDVADNLFVEDLPDDPADPGADAPAIGPPLMPSLLDQQDRGWKRAAVDVQDGMGIYKVITDNCTHQSGRQRGYCNCLVHDSCFRSKFCDEFADRERFVAYLVAWASAGDPRTSAAEHRGLDPEEDVVAAVQAVMVVSDY
jgi:hypothetical protein